MSSNTATTNSHQRTTTEETSMTDSHNFRLGFPFACSCGGDLVMATVQDQTFNDRLCYVCENLGQEGGDHLQKMFDEAVREEIEYMKKQVRDHEARISSVETNIPTEQAVELSREISKVLEMVTSLRQDLEILDLRYYEVYEKSTKSTQGAINRHLVDVSRFIQSGRFIFALSFTVGVFAGYVGHRFGFHQSWFSSRIN